MKVKKTDLPVLPSEQEVLPSLDDDADDVDEEDDDDEEEDMMADEAAESDDDDDYESDEDLDDRDQDEDEGWDSLSTAQSKTAQKELTTTTTAAPITTQKLTEMPTSASSASPDPYFTHFDPRAEHQSYKVKVRIVLSFIEPIFISL